MIRCPSNTTGERVATATWNGAVIAQSDETIIVEGNHYFPPESVDAARLRSSSKHTRCPWKGKADYYDVVVDGNVNTGAAWFYPSPKPAASDIKNYVAFWRGVSVSN
jgi:uncharacterized protein (DUF427 family)